ncbi:MAG: hypothetical protein N5P05_001387 [Chroococcopsis gigantea SAG 12.99]|jgi:hypothetical protein|nr:hypothetical protein [Chlorogloea purpurea SAG 13.99]MDV2999781.1 hypothetical protein [Chroococcopsis gigantea SAG 12.99]
MIPKTEPIVNMLDTKKIILIAVGIIAIFSLWSPFSVSAVPATLPANVENAIRLDLSKRMKLKPDDFQVNNFTVKTWPDGCLGLAKSGEFCTQALVEGWQVTLGHKNKTWTYRTDNSGRNIRLE